MLEDPYEYAPEKPRLIIPALIWLGCIAAAIFIAVQLSGCATAAPFQGVCALKPLGQNDQGIVVVLAHCEARE